MDAVIVSNQTTYCRRDELCNHFARYYLCKRHSLEDFQILQLEQCCIIRLQRSRSFSTWTFCKGIRLLVINERISRSLLGDSQQRRVLSFNLQRLNKFVLKYLKKYPSKLTI